MIPALQRLTHRMNGCLDIESILGFIVGPRKEGEKGGRKERRKKETN